MMGKLKIICRQMLNTHSITLGLYIKAGSGYEREEQQGISHLLEHLHFRRMGQLSQKQLYYKLERIGTELKGVTYHDFMEFSMKLHPDYLYEGLDIIKELLYAYEWNDEEFEKEKAVVLNQIRENDSYLDINREVKKIIFKNTPIGYDIAGTLESVSNLRLCDVQEYKRKMFHSENICFCITGCVDNEMKAKIYKEIESWDLPDGEETADISIPKSFHCRKPDIYFDILESMFLDVNVSFDITREARKDELRNILNCILGEGTGSKLQCEIREEKGYSSNIYSYIERYQNFEILHIRFSVEKANFMLCLEEIVSIIRRMKVEIEISSLETALPFYTKNKIFLEDDTYEMNFQLAYNNFILKSLSENIDEKKREELIEELKEIARKIFLPENASVCVWGNVKNISKKSIKNILFKLR